ncbi:MAG: hypothetical protein HZB46_15030 [Solirubrobacterales bacterium]|nr:hypothetical protein [Solirubrobacterales bacterium]
MPDALGLLGVEPHAVDRGVPAVAGDADVSIVIGRDLVRGVPKVRSYPLRDRAGKAVGTVDVARGAISVRAAGLPPSKVYALWLGRRFLGFFPPVTKDRPLDGHAAVDRAAGELLVTREDGGDRPRRPGTVVLRATLR